MMPAKDLSNQRFGKLVAIERTGSRNRRALWMCICDCGNRKEVSSSHLVRGQTKSCGCLKDGIIHGASRRSGRSKEYYIWLSMRQRCRNPKSKHYHQYGGRGIDVCERWNDFSAFASDMGPRPSARHTVERRDNDLGYSPDNCYWATMKEQANNTRRNIKVTLGEETMNLSQAVEMLGLRYGTVLNRIHRGMSPEEAIRSYGGQDSIPSQENAA